MRRSTRVLLCLLTLWCLGPLGWAAPAIPPQPVPQTVSVARGTRLEIPLRVYGATTEEPRFLIRTPPAHGKLSPLRTGDGHRISVIYEPPTDLAIKADHFSYAAQSSAGVSAAADVTITIVDEEARLVVPTDLQFAQTSAGGTAQREFEILNRGGSMAAGTIVADPPFRVEGADTYQLRPWQSSKFTVVFAPTNPGTFEAQLRYTSHPDALTLMHGQAIAPLTVDPGSVTLAQQPGTPRRRGVTTLFNHTAGPLEVKLEGPERLHLPPTLTIPSQGQATLTLETAAEDLTELHGEVTLTAAGSAIKLPVTAEAAAAMIAASADHLRLTEPSLTGTLALRNAGGREGTWACTLPEPFSVSPARFTLPPGEQRSLEIRCETSIAGAYRAVLQVTGEGQSLETTVECSIGAAATPPPGPAVHATIVAPAAEAPASTPPAPEAEAPAAEERPASAIMRGVRGVKITGRTDHTATLEFPAELAQGRTLHVKLQDLYFDSQHQFQTKWRDLPDSRFKTQGPLTTLEARGLKPGTPQSIRVESAPDGAEVFTVIVTTAPEEPLVRVTSYRLLFLALIGLAGFAVWQKVRQ